MHPERVLSHAGKAHHMRILLKAMVAMLIAAIVGEQLMTAAATQQPTFGPCAPVLADQPDAFGERAPPSVVSNAK